MDIQNILSLIAGFTNLGLGILVYSRGQKSTIKSCYSVVALSVASWCFTVIPFRSAPDAEASLLWAKILYIIPLFIVTSFLFFNYTYLSQKSFRFVHFLSLIPPLAILLLVLWPNMVIREITIPYSKEKENHNGTAYP